MGVKGRRWRLPADPDETQARERLLEVLGLDEAAITDVPDAETRAMASAELYPAERAWLEAACRAGGLTRGGAPSRFIRLLIRTFITHRDLLPLDIELDTSKLDWLEDEPLDERLASLFDALPRETLEQVLDSVQSAIARRDE